MLSDIFYKIEKDDEFPEIIEFIKQCNDVNQKNKNGLALLHVSARNNYFDAIKRLIELGANIELLDDKHNLPPLFYCVLCPYSSYVENYYDNISILINDKTINTHYKNGRNILHYIAYLGHTAMMYVLENKHNNLLQLFSNEKDNLGNIPIYYLIIKEEVDNSVSPPLYYRVINKNINYYLIEVLFKYTDINSTNIDGENIRDLIRATSLEDMFNVLNINNST